jgi:ABC-2 type transport system permease protein
MYSVRVFFIGGLISFRALFHWLTPWIYVPSLLIAPIFQILFFAYVGRSAGIGSDEFYLVGDAVQYVAIPCLFAMANIVAGERHTQTLSIVLATPARRLPLFLGRAVPVVVNGCVVAAFSLVTGSLLLGVTVPASTWPQVALVVVIAATSCTGLGMVTAALALRVRQTAVLSNIIFGLLLVFCGVNLPEANQPGWMAAVGSWLPLTHAIEAARAVVAGSGLGAVGAELLKELMIGAVYFAIGLSAISLLERESRRTGSLDQS